MSETRTAAERNKSMTSIAEKSALGKQIAEKRRTLRQLYGGMMTPPELDRELGRSKGGGAVWARMVGLESVMVSPKRRAYETDRVAEEIVRRRILL